jgi:DNA polymerase I-like protein with 3'-5' exonuclease and polymerase domains
LRRVLVEGGRLVGANTAFDSLVSVVSSPAYMAMLREWVGALEGGRVHDVFVRQKLLDIAADRYGFEEVAPNVWLHNRYNLASLAQRLCKRELSKPEDEDDTDHWRLRFGELAGLPVEQYPAEAYAYALEDAIATAEVWIAQEVARYHDKRIQAHFPGKDPFADEVRQTICTIPLKAMSAYGLRTDAAAVERLAAEVQAKIEEVRETLVEHGLVRTPSYHRDTDAIVSYIRARGLEAHFVEGGQVKLGKARYLTSRDALLVRLTEFTAATKILHADEPQPAAAVAAALAQLEPLLAAGLVYAEHSRDTKAAAKRCVEAYAKSGKGAPRTKGYKEALKKGETPGPYDFISLDADTCAASDDLLLVLYSEYTSLAKTLANDIPMLRSGTTTPVHSRFDELRKTGRTSSSSPNVQNVRRLPGIRECFTPRPGFVFVDCDFGMLELHTLAQVCYWVLGFSTLGDALNAGIDPHLRMAATILRIEYDVAKARREAGDGEVDNARTAGKGVNFGRPGGLSAKTFVVYAWTNYKIRLTLADAQRLIDLYDQTWVEMPRYFGWIKSQKDPNFSKTIIDDEGRERELSRFDIVQPWSQRLRAGAAYCEACNSPFQGLGADVAKLALWLVWKATMGLSELGEADPLFGCRIVNFVHDSIMTEAPEGRAHEAAMRQKELMDLAGRIVLPSVPVKADALVCRQWSKKAQRWKDENGRLIPWDLRVAVRRALEAWRAEHANDNATAALAYLKKKEWPTDVARDAVAEVFGGDAGRIAA